MLVLTRFLLFAGREGEESGTFAAATWLSFVSLRPRRFPDGGIVSVEVSYECGGRAGFFAEAGFVAIVWADEILAQ